MQSAPLISSLLPYEVTRELLGLASEAAEFERRVLFYAITERLPSKVASRELHDLIGTLPDDERAANLYWARRWVGLGQKQYGGLDLATDRRDYRVESSEESPDGFFYAVADLAKHGKTDMRLLRLWTEIKRYGTSELLKVGAI